MKKVLAFVLCTVLLIALVAIPVSAQFALTANKGTVAIDGAKDDIYSGPFDIAAMRNDTPGASGKVWAAWDDANIYYYIEVNDATPNHEHDNSYECDCVEFFIDWNSAAKDYREYDGDPYWQIRIASAPNSSGRQVTGRINGESIEENWSDIKYAVKPLVGNDLNGGYIIETAMPHARAEGAKPLAEGLTVKVDFQVADNQEDSGRTSQAFLTDEDMDGQASRPDACHGILTLLAAPAPAVVEDAAPQGGGEAADAEIAPVVVTATTAPSVRTGDSSAIIFIALAVMLASAFIVTKRISRNRA